MRHAYLTMRPSACEGQFSPAKTEFLARALISQPRRELCEFSCNLQPSTSDRVFAVFMLERQENTMLKQHTHRRRVCGQPGHRQGTCSSYAGRLIRELQRKAQRQSPAAPQQQLRRPRKSGERRGGARLLYTGKTCGSHA